MCTEETQPGKTDISRWRTWFKKKGGLTRPGPVLDKRIPVDKGWAWIIVLACAVSHMLVVGYFRSFGIIFVAYQDTFNTSSAVTAWVPAIRTMTFLSVSPLAQALSNKYTSRKVVMCGGVLSAMGLLLSSQARHITLIALSDGVIAGVGTTFALSPGLVMVAKYFKRYRPFANGLACAGGSVGMFIIPPLLRYLMDIYTVHGALLVTAGMFLHLAVCGAVYRPWEFYTRGGPAIVKPTAPQTNGKQQNTVGGKDDEDDSGPCRNTPNDAEAPFRRNKTLRGSLLSRPIERMQSISEQPGCQTNVSSFFLNETYDITTGMSLNSIPSHYDLDVHNMHSKHTSRIEMVEGRPRLNSDTTREQSVNRTRRPRHVSEGDADYYVAVSFNDLISKKKPLPSDTESANGDNRIGNGHGDKGDSENHCEQNSATPSLKTEPKISHLCICCPLKTSQKKSTKVNKKIFDFNLMKNTVFLSFLGGLLLGHYGFANQLFFLPAHARDIGISKQNAAWMLSAIGVSDLVGRVGCGMFANLELVRKRYIQRVALAILGLGAIVAPYITSFRGMVAYCSILGLAGGSYVAMVPVVLVDLIGLEKIASGMGLIQLFQGLTVPIGAPLLGLIRDESGSYVFCFHIFAVSMLLGVLVLSIEPCATKYEARKEQCRNTDNDPETAEVLIKVHSSKSRPSDSVQ